MKASEPRALTRGWFHGWCQCGSDQLALVDVWPQWPYTVCAGCGHVAAHVSATYYVLHDTKNGRHYLNYRSMEWPYYLARGASISLPYRSVWSRIRLHEKHGGIPS